MSTICAKGAPDSGATSFRLASALHDCGTVSEVQKKSMTDRRRAQGDRRKQSRSGRRASDPNVGWHWRRIAWLFAAYAAYISVRSLPQTLRKYFARPTLS
jgi:hypothetical protein